MGKHQPFPKTIRQPSVTNEALSAVLVTWEFFLPVPRIHLLDCGALMNRNFVQLYKHGLASGVGTVFLPCHKECPVCRDPVHWGKVID